MREGRDGQTELDLDLTRLGYLYRVPSYTTGQANRQLSSAHDISIA